MKIILIAGRAGSGKTYLGERIITFTKEKGVRALQTEYSKYIKMYAKEILGYDGNRAKKPRKFLQDIGSKIREEWKDEHFFTRRILEDFRIYEEYFDLVVISDVRLRREIEDIKIKYKEIITIKVNNHFRDYNLTEEEKNHITETELENYTGFDYNINDENKEGIESIAKEIVKSLI